MKPRNNSIEDYARRTEATTREYMQSLVDDRDWQTPFTSLFHLMQKQLDGLRSLHAHAQTVHSHYVEELDDLKTRMQSVERENDNCRRDQETVDASNTQLVNLFIVCHRLHTAGGEPEVLDCLVETVINLVGSEEFAIHEWHPETGRLEWLAGFGLAKDRMGPVTVKGSDYEPLLATGRLHLAGELSLKLGDRRAVAFIPLRLNGVTRACITIFSLLPHKASLQPLDREIFDLLEQHGAVALEGARAFYSPATDAAHELGSTLAG